MGLNRITQDNFQINTVATTANNTFVRNNYQFINSGSFLLDGINDTFVASSSSIYDYTNNFAFTWAATIQSSTTASNGEVLGKRAATGGWNMLRIGNTIRMVLASIGTNNFIQLTTTASFFNPTSSVYRVMCVYDSSTSSRCKIIVNGVNQGVTDTSTGTISNISTASAFAVGSRVNNAFFWNGKIDEICFWNYDASSLSAEDYNNGVQFNRMLLMSTPPEHYYSANNTGADTGSVGGYTLSAVGGATYGSGIP